MIYFFCIPTLDEIIMNYKTFVSHSPLIVPTTNKVSVCMVSGAFGRPDITHKRLPYIGIYGVYGPVGRSKKIKRVL